VEEPAPVAEPEPQPEPAPEPEPALLPALNAEAEALLPKAEAGDPVAQFNLARQYVLGEGMAVNQSEFIRWCRTAAEQGLPEAQYALGMCYRQGLGVERNTNEARAWMQKAAASRYTPAIEELNR
jgi:TPR repeat protein